MIPAACNLTCDNLCALSAAALSQAFDAWIQTDDTGRIESWHAQRDEQFGWRASDVIGQHLSCILVCEDDRKTCQQAFTRCLHQTLGSDEICRFEFQVRGATGRPY